MAYLQDVVGIDVSKDKLDAFALRREESRVAANAASGYDELIGWLKGQEVRMAVLEASGGYERAAARALRGAGFEVRIVDPKRVRHFAKAGNRHAKNDRIDARVIAEFGAWCAGAGRCEIAADAEREHLAGLLAARQALVAHRTGLRNQLAGVPAGVARRAIEAALAPIAGEIRTLDRAIEAAIRPFAALAARLRTVPGLGPVAVAAAIAWLPELGRLDRRALAALVGVAPFDDDSGQRRGRRAIKGGRLRLRNIFYMAVLGAATRSNPVLIAHYEALIARGKAPKVAIIACLRKLLTILNVMVARQTDWTEKPAVAATSAA